MFWLIWIAMMLLTPIVAGVRVWLQLRGESGDVPSEKVHEAPQDSAVASGVL